MSQQFFSLLEAKVAPPVFIFVFNIFPFFGFFVPVYLILQIGRLGNPDKPIFGSKRKKMKAKTFFLRRRNFGSSNESLFFYLLHQTLFAIASCTAQR